MHEKKEIKQHMTRADAVLIGICLLAAAALTLWFAVFRKEGRTFQVSYDGEVVVTEALDAHARSKDGPIYYLFLFEESEMTWERFETYPEIPDGVNYNLLSVFESEVSMEAADCRDQICVHHRPVSAGGESIICLPHRLAVEIAGGTDGAALDGMVE